MDRLTTMELIIPFDRYDLISQLHQQGHIKEETMEDDGIHLAANVPARLRAVYEPYRKCE